MDPTATLVSIRALVKVINESSVTYDLARYAEELADLVDGLDRWMTRGGFLPTQWRSIVRPPQ